jgi:hypothetical protein
MKLTYKSILQLRAALATLDGLEKSVEVRGHAQLIKKPFKFAGKTRLKIARNLRVVEAAFDDYDAARVGLVRELSDGGEQVPPEKIAGFTQRLGELLAEETDVALRPLAETELNLDDNEISHTTLAVLLEHLVDAENAD